MNTPIKHELPNGVIEWRLQNGMLHRENGPSVIFPNGGGVWFLYGHLHRTDGPAVICSDGTTEYWLDDMEYDPITFLIKQYEYTRNC